MSLSATVRALVLAGATPEMILAVVEVHEQTAGDALAARRASDAARQQAKRDRDAFSVAPSRDVTLAVDDVTVSSPHVGERSQVVTPSLPSLRSEELKTPKKPSVSIPKGTKTRGSKRVPTSWIPEKPTLTALEAEGHTPGDLERALTRMRDHEFRTPRSDWDAAFRNWVRNDADRKPRHERPHPDAKFARRAANSANADLGAYAAARQRFDP